ncbi:MAG: hypothetical protein NVS3B20_26800 [Polyangiales bacterium]
MLTHDPAQDAGVQVPPLPASAHTSQARCPPVKPLVSMQAVPTHEIAANHASHRAAFMDQR